MSVPLGRFMERSGVLPTIQFAHRKGLGTCDALLCVSHTLQSALESGQEARIVQIDSSAAFDRVNHPGILYKLCSVDIGGSVLSILAQFPSNRSQQVMVDGCRSKLVNVVSGVPQGSVVQSPGIRVAVAESLTRDLGQVGEWCDLWGMKLNASKTNTMIVSKSPPLTIGGAVLKEPDDLVILGVTFDSKMTFEKHLRSVSMSSFSKTWYPEEVLASVP